MATQWSNHSCSTQVLSPATQKHNRQYRHQAGHSQHDIGYVSAPEFYPLQVTGSGRFSQPTPYYDSGINIINALEGYSLFQVLMQMAMNLIQEFNSMDRKATIPWLDHIEGVARKTGFDPLEIGMIKLKGMALCNVNAISKEGNLSYFWFCQLLIEHYLNILYMSDALNAYANLMQGKNKTLTQYLARTKVLLEVFTILLNCEIFQEVAMTIFTLSEDCIHYMFEDGLCLNRTPGSQWKCLPNNQACHQVWRAEQGILQT